MFSSCGLLALDICRHVCWLYFTWQESGTMLWLHLLFRNTLFRPPHTTGTAVRFTDRGHEQSRVISCSLCHSVSCYWPKEDIVAVQVELGTQILDLTGSSSSRTGLNRPGSSYCSVREYHIHGPLPARAVLRSAKIRWNPLQQELGLLLPCCLTRDTLQNIWLCLFQGWLESLRFSTLVL